MSRPKFCPKCGNSLEDAGKFCGKCGTPIVDTEEALAAQPAPQPVPPQPAPGPVPPQQGPVPGQFQPGPVPPQQGPIPGQFQPGPVPAPKPPKPPKDPNKTFGAWIKRHKLPIILSGVGVAALAAGLIVFFQLTKYQKIDAQKLFAFKYKGINGSGTAVAYLNSPNADPDPYSYVRDKDGNKVEKEYSDYFSTDKKTLLKAFDKASDYEQAVEMRNALLAKSKGQYDLKVNMSKSTGLSNGDKISCTVEFDEEELKDALIKLENTEFEVEADGFVDGEQIDLFAGFDPKFTGMDERGEVDDSSTKGTYPFIRYYLSSGGYNLKNGDKVTFQANFSSYDVEDYTFIDDNDSSKGAYFVYEGKTYIISNTTEEKEFTVSGLTEAKQVDIFEKVKFETTGAIPYLRINRVNTDDVDGDIKDCVSYYLDLGDQKSFKAGDTFKIKAYVSDSLLSKGYKPTEAPDEDGYCYKEFTVDETSYGHYITEKSQPADLDAFKDKFAEFTKKFQDDYTGRSYLGGLSLGGKIKSIDTFEAVKDYIVINDGFYEGTIGLYDAKTNLHRFYKVSLTVTDDDGKDSKKTIYAGFKFSGPFVDSKGEAQLESNFVNITVAAKEAELKKSTVDKVDGGKVYEIGKGETKKDDDSSKKDDDSSKKDDSSSKKDDSSSKKDDSSSKKGDDSSKKDDSSSKKDEASSEEA